MGKENNTYEINDVMPYVNQVNNGSWIINFKGASCKFELSSDKDAIIYHLEVPNSIRNQGIGTILIHTAEYIVRNQTNAQNLYISIGAPTDASKYVVENKCGFEITGEEYSDVHGTIIDGFKIIK